MTNCQMTDEKHSIQILLQYYISTSTSIADVEKYFPIVKIFIQHGQLNILTYLQILLKSLPSFFKPLDIVKLIEEVLDLQNNEIAQTTDEIIDLQSLLDVKDGNIPQIFKYYISLSDEQQSKLFYKSKDSLNEYSYKYNLDLTDNMTAAELFQIFMKSWIFRITDEFSSYEITNTLIPLIKGSRFASLELLDWIDGFYSPLSKVCDYLQNNYALIQLQNVMSIEEIIEMIALSIKDDESANYICNQILLPYLCYHAMDSWVCFNGWMVEFGKKCSVETNTDKIINNYGIILSILRQDNFLREMNKLSSDIIDSFVSNIVSIIYTLSRTNLQIFIYAKEILILLKTLNLKEDKSTGVIDLQNVKSFATRQVIDALIEIINVGEILYSNELTIIDIIALENASESVQTEQVTKYINNEIAGDVSSKKWKLLLSSIYSTLKKSRVFNKIGDDKLSEVILEKLLNLKQYDFILTVFRNEFNFLSEERFDEIIEAYCWSLYMNATNCDPNIGSLKNCLKCSELLPHDSKQYKNLNLLIEANSKIMDWKFYFKAGHPVTPKDIIECDDPFTIIRRILELNEKAYTYTGDLYYLLVLLINGLSNDKIDDLFEENKDKSCDDKSNLLAIKLKLILLEFSVVNDYNFSFNLSKDLINNAIQNKNKVDGLYDLVSENWFTFFQLTKNEYPEVMIESNLELLSDILLITPTEFNNSVLEHWQMLNSEKETMQQHTATKHVETSKHSNVASSLGDVQARLQRSIKSSADELINANGADIGKNIIGWIVGAN